MTLIIQFADGTTQTALSDTTVYPSTDMNTRSYAEIHLDENAMSFIELEALFTDTSKTSQMHFILQNEEDQILIDQVYDNFILLTECGKKIVKQVDIESGRPIEIMHLVARLEQPTYTEQLIEEMQEAYRIITEGE